MDVVLYVCTYVSILNTLLVYNILRTRQLISNPKTSNFLEISNSVLFSEKAIDLPLLSKPPWYKITVADEHITSIINNQSLLSIYTKILCNLHFSTATPKPHCLQTPRFSFWKKKKHSLAPRPLILARASPQIPLFPAPPLYTLSKISLAANPA